MKCFSKVLLCSLVSTLTLVTNAFCAPRIQCLEQIGQDTNGFLDPLKTMLSGEKLDQSFVDSNKASLFKLFATNLKSHCGWREYNDIADSDSVKVAFQLDNQKYDIAINTERLFDFIEMQTGFLVAKDLTKEPGSVLTDSDKPADNPFPDDCSDYYVQFNIDDDAPVNKAGQAAFASYGGKDEEFFLDFGTKHECKFFPGIVLMDCGGWWNNCGQVVVYNNYRTARNAFKTFSSHLNSTKCGNHGLAVYHILLPKHDYTQGIRTDADSSIIFTTTSGVLNQLEILSDPEIIH